MPAAQLAKKTVRKPWGRRTLPAGFGAVGDGEEPVGEIWYELAGEAPELLVKYLFTSERLSIQVHPDEAGARRLGLAGGKDEAWIVLDAEPGATIGLGLTRAVERDALRAAALDGSIETLLDWRPAAAGDVFYLPAGTIHALGPGLTIAEFQQNVDVTLRLYDYGRPRALHLDEALEVAQRGVYVPCAAPRPLGGGRTVLVEGGRFVVERWRAGTEAALDAGECAWIVPVTGACFADGDSVAAGEVALVRSPARLRAGHGCDLLVAYPGAAVRDPAR